VSGKFLILFITLGINHNEVDVHFCMCFKVYGRGDGTRLIMTHGPRLQSQLTVFSYPSLTTLTDRRISLLCLCLCLCLCQCICVYLKPTVFWLN